MLQALSSLIINLTEEKVEKKKLLLYQIEREPDTGRKKFLSAKWDPGLDPGIEKEH